MSAAVGGEAMIQRSEGVPVITGRRLAAALQSQDAEPLFPQAVLLANIHPHVARLMRRTEAERTSAIASGENSCYAASLR